MKYAVDEIIDDIVKLQNISDGNIIYVNITSFKDKINESDIVIKSGDIYIKDIDEKQRRITMLREKMEKLKNNKES